MTCISHRLVVALASLCLLACFRPEEAEAQPSPRQVETVRGSVRQERSDGSLVAAASIPVFLKVPSGTLTTFTEQQGFYYFKNVPQGTHTLTVAASAQPKNYDVTVDTSPFTDLPPVILPTRLQAKSFRAAYRNARIAMTAKDWTGALFVLQQIKDQWPETKANRDRPMPGPGGDDTESYRLHFYLGVAYFHLGDCQSAWREWQAERSLGPMLADHNDIVKGLLPKCPHPPA